MSESNTAKSAAMKLLERRDDLQAELNTQYAILEANDATMKTALVDEEGFPRAGKGIHYNQEKSILNKSADIDVYNVRLARVRIIEIGNDLKAITDDMGRALEGVYENEVLSLTPEKEVKGFARVKMVVGNSPAEEAVSR